MAQPTATTATDGLSPPGGCLFNSSPERGLRSSPDLDSDLGGPWKSHIVMNVSSTLTNTTIWFVAALCFIVDLRTYGRTDVLTDGHFYRVY